MQPTTLHSHEMRSELLRKLPHRLHSMRSSIGSMDSSLLSLRESVAASVTCMVESASSMSVAAVAGQSKPLLHQQLTMFSPPGEALGADGEAGAGDQLLTIDKDV